MSRTGEKLKVLSRNDYYSLLQKQEREALEVYAAHGSETKGRSISPPVEKDSKAAKKNEALRSYYFSKALRRQRKQRARGVVVEYPLEGLPGNPKTLTSRECCRSPLHGRCASFIFDEDPRPLPSASARRSHSQALAQPGPQYWTPALRRQLPYPRKSEKRIGFPCVAPAGVEAIREGKWPVDSERVFTISGDGSSRSGYSSESSVDEPMSRYGSAVYWGRDRDLDQGRRVPSAHRLRGRGGHIRIHSPRDEEDWMGFHSASDGTDHLSWRGGSYGDSSSHGLGSERSSRFGDELSFRSFARVPSFVHAERSGPCRVRSASPPTGSGRGASANTPAADWTRSGSALSRGRHLLAGALQRPSSASRGDAARALAPPQAFMESWRKKYDAQKALAIAQRLVQKLPLEIKLLESLQIHVDLTPDDASRRASQSRSSASNHSTNSAGNSPRDGVASRGFSHSRSRGGGGGVAAPSPRSVL